MLLRGPRKPAVRADKRAASRVPIAPDEGCCKLKSVSGAKVVPKEQRFGQLPHTIRRYYFDPGLAKLSQAPGSLFEPSGGHGALSIQPRQGAENLHRRGPPNRQRAILLRQAVQLS